MEMMNGKPLYGYKINQFDFTKEEEVSDEVKIDIEQLKKDMAENVIFRGTISNVGRKEDGFVLYAKADGFEAAIPFDEFFTDNPVADAKTNAEKKARSFRLSTNTLKANIVFLITDIKQDKDGKWHFTGSRRRAMKMLEKNFFFDKSDDGLPLARKDVFVQANIISVGPNAIWAEVLGVDVQINKSSLSYMPLGDLRAMPSLSTGEVIKNGTKLNVILTKVEYSKDNTGSHVTLEVSHKLIEIYQGKKKAKSIEKRTICMGTVSSIRYENKVPIKMYCWLSSYNIPAIAEFTPNAIMLQDVTFGSEVVLQADGLSPSGLLHCRVLSVSCSPYANI